MRYLIKGILHSDDEPDREFSWAVNSEEEKEKALAVPFSSHLHSCPASGSFPMSQFFPSGGQSIGVSLQHQSFQSLFRVDFLLD